MRNIYLIARRDYLGYVTAWGFWLGLLLTPFLLGIGMIAPSLASSSSTVRYYSVIEDGQGRFLEALTTEDEAQMLRDARDVIESIDSPIMSTQFETALAAGATPKDALAAANVPIDLAGLGLKGYTHVDPPGRTVEALTPYLLGEKQVDGPDGPKPLTAAIFVPSNGGAIEIWNENIGGEGLRSRISKVAADLAQADTFNTAGVSLSLLEDARNATPDVVDKRIDTTSDTGGRERTLADEAPRIVSIAIAFFLWILIFSVVNYLLMGTIEERSNKIFDTLLTSVRLPELLAGKLLAVLAVSLTLMSVWGIGGTAVSLFAASALPSSASGAIATVAGAALTPGILIPALLSFLLGYLIYGAMFLALGSLCDTIQEAQTLMTPLLVLLMVPLFMVMVAISDPEAQILSTLSWVPLFTPFLLILRMPTEPPLWEILTQMGLMAGFTILVLWLAARIYRAGAVNGAGVNDVAAWVKGLFGRSKTMPEDR